MGQGAFASDREMVGDGGWSDRAGIGRLVVIFEPRE
jgi:hypothetical protein